MARLSSLSTRERQVFERVLAGKISRTISDELFISVKTVEFHRLRIMRKLEVGSVRELFQHYGSATQVSALDQVDGLQN